MTDTRLSVKLHQMTIDGKAVLMLTRADGKVAYVAEADLQWEEPVVSS